MIFESSTLGIMMMMISLAFAEHSLCAKIFKVPSQEKRPQVFILGTIITSEDESLSE